MCGIVGVTGADQAAPLLLEGLKRLEYRGYDSAGIAVHGENGITIVKETGRLGRLAGLTDDGRSVSGVCGIGHTRWATHGKPDVVNAHPHASPGNRVVMVHNGIIENYRELAGELEEQGYAFRSATDTEAAALLLDSLYAPLIERGMQPVERALHAIGAMMKRLRGSYALGILFSDQPDCLYAVRMGSPLVIGAAEGNGRIIASDITALLGRTKRAVYMEDGEIARLTAEAASVYDRNGQRVEKAEEAIRWNESAADRGGYAHYMMKEICEQPEAVRATIARHIREEEGDKHVDLGAAACLEEELAAAERLILIGCGSAYHAACAGRAVIEQLAHIPCEAELASEMRSRAPVLNARAAAIVISQSGETADSLAALRLCKAHGMRALAVVNVQGSSMAREADGVLYTFAGPEIAVATTKAYSAQLAVLDLLAVRLAVMRGAIDGKREEELLDKLLALPEKIGRIIADHAQIEPLAQRLACGTDAYFIGRGLDCAVCMEGSLKLKEVSCVHSEAYAAGELKHGTLSLIEEGIPVIAVATQPQLLVKTLSNMAEAKSRGAYVAAVLPCGCGQSVEEADMLIHVPDTEPLFMASLAVIPLQLLAYYAGCAKGLDVDKPRNLAKSVTVE